MKSSRCHDAEILCQRLSDPTVTELCLTEPSVIRGQLFDALQANSHLRSIVADFRYSYVDISPFLQALRLADHMPLEDLTILSPVPNISVEICAALEPHKHRLRKIALGLGGDLAITVSDTLAADFLKNDAAPNLKELSLREIELQYPWECRMYLTGVPAAIFQGLSTNTVLQKLQLGPFESCFRLDQHLVHFLSTSAVTDLTMKCVPILDGQPIHHTLLGHAARTRNPPEAKPSEHLLESFKNALADNRSLIRLDWEGMPPYLLLPPLANNKTLTNLAGSVPVRNRQEMEMLNDLLRRNTTLERIRYIKFTDLKEAGVLLPTFFDAVRKSALKQLGFGLPEYRASRPSVRSTLAESLIPMIAENHSLENLSVGESKYGGMLFRDQEMLFRDQDVVLDLFRAIGQNGTLQSLCLGSELNVAGADTVNGLIQALRQNHTITHLEIYTAGLSEDGLVRLAQYLKTENRTLERVKLALDFSLRQKRLPENIVWRELSIIMEGNPRIVVDDNCHRPKSSIYARGMYLASLNRSGRQHLLNETIPPSLWPHVLKHVSKPQFGYSPVTQDGGAADRILYFLRFAIVHENLLRDVGNETSRC